MDDDGTGETNGLKLEPALPVTRFCRYCGAPIEAGVADCPVCVERAQRGLKLASNDRTGARPVASALALYFVLLLTTIVACLAFEEEVLGEITCEAIDTVIVLIWVAVCWRAIKPGLTVVPSAGWLLGACGLGGLTFILATILVGSVVHVLEIEEILLTPAFFEAGYGWAAVFVVGCVQPAIVEELAFRRVVLSGLQQVLNNREAIIVSALLFMTLHLAFFSFPHLFILGVLLGYLRVRTGSFYPGMLLHGVHNLLCLLLETA